MRPPGRIVGVNLRDLFAPKPVPMDWYSDKRIAVDGHNTAFRYMTSIRGKDGDVLRNADGRATGHILGILGLIKTLRQHGAEPVWIWDGDVHPRKQATVDERIRKRQQAMEAAEAAKQAGDMSTYHRMMRGTVYLDRQMIEDASRILEALGIAVVRADHDGERYAAALCHEGHADAVASEDFDALVAGAPSVLRKAGSQDPFLLELSDLADHDLDASALRAVAILCGTDWHPGVKGFGAKTAVKALRAHDLQELWAEAQAGSSATRFHKLIAQSGMTWDEFADLDAFIASLPAPSAPRAPKPCPEMATEVAKEIGLRPDRVLACFT